MPVIRIDDDVWKELQKRAQPLVDTPNSVLRRLFKLDSIDEPPSAAEPLQEIQYSINTTLSPRKYFLLPLPKRYRHFFPGYKEGFILETDFGAIRTHVTSRRAKNAKVGDPDEGYYIQTGLKEWFDGHPELSVGDILQFKAIEPGKRYRLSLHHRPDEMTKNMNNK